MSLYHVYTQTVADGTATSVVRPSDWNSAHLQQYALSGNTNGSSVLSGLDVTFVGGNNLTLSADTAGSKLVFSVGNYLTTAMQSGASTQFVQANAAFFGTNASGTIASNAISVSVNAGGGGGVAISAGTNSTSTGTVVFSNASGVSFGMDTNGVVTATVKTDYLTTQTVQTQASGGIAGTGFTSTTTAGVLVVGTNATNGLSLGVPAFITTYAAQTNQTQASGGIAGTGFTSTTTNGVAITAALGTNGLSVAVPNYLTTAMQSNASTISNINISAGTTSNDLSAFVLSNSNGLAFGLNGSTLTGSYSQSTHPHMGISAGTNSQNTGTVIFSNSNSFTFGLETNGVLTASFSQSNQAFSADASSSFQTLVFQNSNGVSFSNNAGSLRVTHDLQFTSLTSAITSNAFPSANTTKFAGTGFTSTTTAGAVVTAALGTNGLSMAVPNYLTTAALSGDTSKYMQEWNLLGANTAGTTSSAQGLDLFLSGGNGITLSGSSNTIVISAGGAGGTTNQTGPNIAVPGTTITAGTVVFSNANGISFGLNGSTMTASATGANTISYYPLYELGNNTAFTSYGQNSLYFQVFRPEENVSMSAVQMLMTVSQSSGNNPQTAGNTFSYGLYSKGTGASTSQYLSFVTSSMYINLTANGSASWAYTIGQGTQSATNSNTASSNISTLFTGMKVLNMPFGTSVSVGGEYLLAFARSSSSAGTTNTLFAASNLVMTMLSGQTASFGALDVTNGAQVTNSSRTNEFQQVVYSATSGAWPSTIGASQLSNNGATVNHMYAWLEA